MRVNRTLYLLPLTVFAFFLTSLAHADFQDGLDAYNRGDYETAFKEWHPLAEQGNAQAQYYLGVLYFKGEGVPQDYAQARKWWRKAAAQGHAIAQFNLGGLHSKGRGVPQGYVQAHIWFNLAAAQGQKKAAEIREQLANKMTPEQTAEAQRLASEWKPIRSKVEGGSSD